MKTKSCDYIYIAMLIVSYDSAGNRLSKTTYAYTTGTLGTATDTETYTYTGDRMDGTTYDEIGNPLTYNNFVMTWEGRQLMELNFNAGQIVYSYAYNSDGIRTSKTVGNTKHEYVLNGSRIVYEIWRDNLLVYLYDESGAPIGLQYRNSTYAEYAFDTYYFEKNLQGDVVGVYDKDGRRIGYYTYDAWGNMNTYGTSGTTTLERQIVQNYNPFRYRGYFYDIETGLYYLQSRYYNPQTGRFLNVDGYVSTGTGLLGYNMYAYCNNNPVMYVDETGYMAMFQFGGYCSGANEVIYAYPGNAMVNACGGGPSMVNPSEKQAKQEAQDATFRIHDHEDGTHSVRIDVQLNRNNTNMNIVERQYYYKALYDRAYQVAVGSGYDMDDISLMSTFHICWEYEVHVIGYYVPIERIHIQCSTANLNVEETWISIICRATGGTK